MSRVEPIRDLKKIKAMKKILRKESKRNLLLFTLGINTGMSTSEILGLKVSDVLDSDFQVRDHIVIKRPGGRQERLMLNRAVKSAVKEYLVNQPGIQPGKYLFPSRKGNNRPISRIQVWHVLNDAARRVGIEESIGTHTLRKTFGYHAYQQGIDIKYIQKVFNHLCPSVTLRYIGAEEIENDRVSPVIKL